MAIMLSATARTRSLFSRRLTEGIGFPMSLKGFGEGFDKLP
jgi:invasion protein IalB